MANGSIPRLPLEALLQSMAADPSARFPNTSFNYFDKYCEVKRILDEQYYRSTGAGLALSGYRYTRHDLSHVDDVIRQAGYLIGCHDREAKDPPYRRLEPYEVFVLLYAILLHDAGTARARKGHEKEPRKVLQTLGDASGLDSIQVRLVASIARAHGGRTENGDKDTITDLISQEDSKIVNIPVRSRRLAALVRLADELSDNPHRADPDALRKGFREEPNKATPPESVIQNLYCDVVNPNIDYIGRSLTLEYNVDKQLLDVEYPNDEEIGDLVAGNRVFLVDYIAARINKLEMERRYCNRFLWDFITYDRCRVALKIFDDLTVVKTLSVDLEDAGYPVLAKPLKVLKPEFDGVTLKTTFGVVLEDACHV